MSVRRKRWFSLKSERSADVQRLVAMIGCALYACRSFFCATFERMPGSDTVENAALMASLCVGMATSTASSFSLPALYCARPSS